MLDAPSRLSRPRLPFLDGIRGLAALSVLLFHATNSIELDALHSPALLGILKIIRILPLGSAAVAVFIVLSGYSLMLPVAAANDTLTGEWRSFFYRRARRILPPYWAALLLSALLPYATYGVLYLLHAWHGQARLNATLAWPHLSAPDAIAHLLLLHNLNAAWNQSINPAMWSVATEWQIYFLFALLLLPIYRWIGAWRCVLAALLIGLTPHWLLPSSANLDWARFWYLGLFAMGMWAADLSYRSALPTAWWRGGRAGLLLAVGLMLLSAWLYSINPASVAGQPLQDVLTGAAAALLILHCVGASLDSAAVAMRPQPSWTRSGLEWQPIEALGGFSYSLYLTHLPVLHTAGYAIVPLHLPPAARVIVQLIVCVIASLAFAYAFSLAFEKPFLKKRSPAGTESGSRSSATAIAAADASLPRPSTYTPTPSLP